MLQIDSLYFLVPALLLVLGLRWLPVRWGRWLYCVVSLAMFGVLLPNWSSRAMAVCFAYAPFVYWRVLRRVGGPSLVVLIVLQALVVLWVRGYAGILPALAGSVLVEHGLVVVGISYLVLRQIEWLFSMDAEPETPTTVADYTAFLLGFFTLLAGPILRYEQFRSGFLAPAARVAGRDLLPALHRIVNGYVKLSLLGPLLQRLSSSEFVTEQPPSGIALALCFYLYPLFLYFNFAGYCDVVIGLGRLAGFRIPENFDHPFRATNVQEFWQRWHMTFSAWVREMLFFPLLKRLHRTGLRRHPDTASALATLLAFLFVGLWHGPTASFALFGLLHGVAVLLVAPFDRWLDRGLGPRGAALYRGHPASRFLRWAVCFHFLCLTIALFDRSVSEILALVGHVIG